MSNVAPSTEETVCSAGGPAAVDLEVLAPREVPLGGSRAMTVRRTLPHRDRRMVGAWCFVDDYGPDDITGTEGMQVPPHPHAGLQTVSWLLEGEVLHRDSLGSEQLVVPGELSLMTAGHGISHSEESPPGRSGRLRGVQLWVALPVARAGVAPSFEHHGSLPRVIDGGLEATVVVGSLGEVASPAATFSPLLGVDVVLGAGARGALPLDADHEYAVLSLEGEVTVEGHRLATASLTYLGTGRRRLSLAAEEASRLLLIGGEPFDEQIVMWWNFVAADHAAILAARRAWEAGRRQGGAASRFGVVHGYDGSPLPAPDPPATALRPRGRSRG